MKPSPSPSQIIQNYLDSQGKNEEHRKALLEYLQRVALTAAEEANEKAKKEKKVTFDANIIIPLMVDKFKSDLALSIQVSGQHLEIVQNNLITPYSKDLNKGGDPELMTKGCSLWAALNEIKQAQEKQHEVLSRVTKKVQIIAEQEQQTALAQDDVLSAEVAKEMTQKVKEIQQQADDISNDGKAAGKKPENTTSGLVSKFVKIINNYAKLFEDSVNSTSIAKRLKIVSDDIQRAVRDINNLFGAAGKSIYSIPSMMFSKSKTHQKDPEAMKMELVNSSTTAPTPFSITPTTPR